MHPMLNISLRAARKASSLIIKFYEKPGSIEISQKFNNYLVTNVDKAAEIIIINTIRKYYPQHTFFSKDNGKQEGVNQDIQWVIDPLNGTTNFIKNLPHFAISIAVRIKGRTEVAVVYDPIRNELFTATRGHGAQLNGYRLRINDTRNLNETIIATGFPSKIKQNYTTYMNIFTNLLSKCANIRYTGSAALDLVYVAAGRIDGYFEIDLKQWDLAAGELIAREAAALVCDFAGGHDYLLNGNIVAGSPHMVKKILTNIHDKLNKNTKVYF